MPASSTSPQTPLPSNNLPTANNNNNNNNLPPRTRRPVQVQFNPLSPRTSTLVTATQQVRPIYIYPGLLRLARSQAVALDAKCPALVYSCQLCKEELEGGGKEKKEEEEGNEERGNGEVDIEKEGMEKEEEDDGLKKKGKEKKKDGKGACKCSMTADGKPGEADVEAVTILCKHQDACAICMERFHSKDLVRKLPCGNHALYHSLCILRWLEKHSRCPLCNQSLKWIRGCDCAGNGRGGGRGRRGGRGGRSGRGRIGIGSGTGNEERDTGDGGEDGDDMEERMHMRPYLFRNRSMSRSSPRSPRELSRRLSLPTVWTSSRNSETSPPLPSAPVPTAPGPRSIATSTLPVTRQQSFLRRRRRSLRRSLPSLSTFFRRGVDRRSADRRSVDRRSVGQTRTEQREAGRRNSIDVANANCTESKDADDGDAQVTSSPPTTATTKTAQKDGAKQKSKSKKRYYSYIMHDNVRFDRRC